MALQFKGSSTAITLPNLVMAGDFTWRLPNLHYTPAPDGDPQIIMSTNASTTVEVGIYNGGNIYVKAGYSKGDVLTIENLGTGGAYPNTTIDGIVVGLGYDKDLPNGMFVRMEANFMDYDSVQVTNTNDSTKQITIDGVGGYGAKLSIGKSF